MRAAAEGLSADGARSDRQRLWSAAAMLQLALTAWWVVTAFWYRSNPPAGKGSGFGTAALFLSAVAIAPFMIVNSVALMRGSRYSQPWCIAMETVTVLWGVASIASREDSSNGAALIGTVVGEWLDAIAGATMVLILLIAGPKERDSLPREGFGLADDI